MSFLQFDERSPDPPPSDSHIRFPSMTFRAVVLGTLSSAILSVTGQEPVCRDPFLAELIKAACMFGVFMQKEVFRRRSLKCHIFLLDIYKIYGYF